MLYIEAGTLVSFLNNIKMSMKICILQFNPPTYGKMFVFLYSSSDAYFVQIVLIYRARYSNLVTAYRNDFLKNISDNADVNKDVDRHIEIATLRQK